MRTPPAPLPDKHALNSSSFASQLEMSVSHPSRFRRHLTARFADYGRLSCRLFRVPSPVREATLRWLWLIVDWPWTNAANSARKLHDEHVLLGPRPSSPSSTTFRLSLALHHHPAYTIHGGQALTCRFHWSPTLIVEHLFPYCEVAFSHLFKLG